MQPLVTVITAVWHQQRDKLSLLAGHNANLKAQTVPCRPIYVFDGGDVAPDFLDGTVLQVSEPLSLYQAWNIALAATTTPLVANLNLDDRLAPDALEKMMAALAPDPNAYLVGGDWKICHSEDETDAVRPCFRVQELELFGSWPPGPEPDRRLGTGDGANSNTYGPACMWRMDAHVHIPRYPYRFGDGTLIRGIADGIWWQLIERQLQKKLLRLPLVIGNYRTWPETQAEFRYRGERAHLASGIAMI